ncbi:Uncharacterised protein [Mycobacteroides abscessus subsp. abscessus]|nr:Uncharacterised protein [Mycobacteroides abscessus subsp. abscessus]
MLMAPKSLTTTPIRTPRVLRSRLFSSVVLPAPKNPETMVIGIKLCSRHFSAHGPV